MIRSLSLASVMERASTNTRPLSRGGGDLKAISYDDTRAAQPPIVVTLAPPLPNHSSPKLKAGFRRPRTAPSEQLSPYIARSKLQDNVRRDSGLAPSSSTARDSRTTLATDDDSVASPKLSPSLRTIPSQDSSSPISSKKLRKWGNPKVRVEPPPVPQLPFLGIVTEIPTGSLEDLAIPGQLQFSKRGSMLIGGKKVNSTDGEAPKQSRVIGSRRKPSVAMLSPSPRLPIRVLSADDEVLSHKVRSMYEGGMDGNSDLNVGTLLERGRSEFAEGNATTTDSPASISQRSGTGMTKTTVVMGARVTSHETIYTSKRESPVTREENELAGGIEDWEDLTGGDVDRYGFIVPRVASQGSSLNSRRANSPQPPRLQRVATSLHLASEAPRKQKSNLKRSPSAHSTSRSTAAATSPRSSLRFSRPASSQSSYRGSINGSLRIRLATNRLPHNKARRCMDEAGDMLTLPPGLADIAENDEDSKVAENLKRREWEREEKWRKMARLVQNNRDGGGMVFNFDTKSPKVIDRTWKGIPDRWRATAWHAFLTASAKKQPGSLSDNSLIATFWKLIDQGSPDDVQIDIDVPRTINSHIMFRRRYRGGQRLLFRVLHCLSIYFPDTGYVQGMAALAATLLCYFDEEMTFVMLVRLWQLRGLKRLFQVGFEGLMRALEEFENTWLAGGEVSAKLVRSISLLDPSH